MENTNAIPPEIYAAIAGALVAFLLAISWQFFIDRRNKILLTYSKKIETPLNIPKKELKEKLKIFYNNNEIKDIYYARLTIKNTGQKTVKNQIFRCEFSENSKPIDPKFPLVTTSPEKEVPIKDITRQDQEEYQPNVFRYQIEALGPNQSVQIDFLFDGGMKDFKILFRPNEINEVKIIEGSLSSNPNLEYHVLQFGFNIVMYITLLILGSYLSDLGGLAVLVAIPFLYNAYVSFKKLIPLLIESKIMQNEINPGYQIKIGENTSSGLVIGSGTLMMNTEDDNEKKQLNKKSKKRP